MNSKRRILITRYGQKLDSVERGGSAVGTYTNRSRCYWQGKRTGLKNSKSYIEIPILKIFALSEINQNLYIEELYVCVIIQILYLRNFCLSYNSFLYSNRISSRIWVHYWSSGV